MEQFSFFFLIRAGEHRQAVRSRLCVPDTNYSHRLAELHPALQLTQRLGEGCGACVFHAWASSPWPSFMPAPLAWDPGLAAGPGSRWIPGSGCELHRTGLWAPVQPSLQPPPHVVPRATDLCLSAHSFTVPTKGGLAALRAGRSCARVSLQLGTARQVCAHGEGLCPNTAGASLQGLSQMAGDRDCPSSTLITCKNLTKDGYQKRRCGHSALWP